MTSSEDVLLEVANVKHKKDDGRLYVMSERLAWIQGNKDVVTVSHKYADIKSQKISPEGKPKIQLQIVLHDGSTFTFHFVNPNGPAAQYKDRDEVKELLLQLLPRFKRKMDQELEEKNRLLSDNPKLLKLYKDLVTDDIVTAEEFWSDHAPQFMASYNKKTTVRQDTGVSSGFLSGIQPETDGANGLRYNLTTDVIASIFKTYPAVKKKHAETVPSQMSESVFWTKFFQSHYFHRDRLPVLKDLFSDCAKSDDKEMRRELEKMRGQQAGLMAILEDTENTGFFKEEAASSSGTNGESSKDKDAVTPQGIYRNMIKRFNHHSIMILKSCERSAEEQNKSSVPSTSTPAVVPAPPQPPAETTPGPPEEPMSKKKKKKRDREREKEKEILENGVDLYAIPPEVKKAKLAEQLVYEDLADNNHASYSKLSLSRIDRYLNGPIPDFKTDVISIDQVKATAGVMRDHIGRNRWNRFPHLLDSATAVKIVEELRPGGVLMKRYRSETSAQTVPPEIDAEMHTMYTSLSELLRHFWSCFPPTTPQLEEKVVKTYDTIEKFRAVKMQMLTEKLLRDHLSAGPLLAHAESMIAAAEAKFAQWLQRTRRV